MFERKRTKRQEMTYAELLYDLSTLEVSFQQLMPIRRTVPTARREIAKEVPRGYKARITASFDRDMVKWFRSLDPGYQARMNAALRANMLAVVSKQLEGPFDRDWKDEPIRAAAVADLQQVARV